MEREQPSSAADGSRRPLRLVYVVPAFPRLSETFVLNELRELERLGDEVTVVAQGPPERGEPLHPGAAELAAGVVLCPQGKGRALRLAGAGASELAAGGLCAWRALGLALELALASRRPAPSLRAFAEACALRRRVPAATDLVHAHFAQTAPTGAVLARLLGCPFSFTGHAADLFVLAPARLLRAEIREARLAVATSELAAARMRAVARPADRAKVVAHENGIDRTRFRPRAAEPPGVPLLVCVARLVPKKGLDTLLESLSLLAGRGVEARCELIGDGELRKPLEQHAGRLGLDGRVRFLGPLAEDGVAAALERATAFVLPCRVAPGGDRDGIPNALREAMAVGVPVVAGDAGGVAEAVAHERTGLLVPPDSPDALADAIERLLRDPELRARLVAGGRERTAGADVSSSAARLRERLAEAAALSARRPGR
jgi:glycosyltransferase involved in cell wall biosynthesis